MLHLIRHYPKMIEHTDNRELYREITKEEICGLLETFRKDKSLSLSLDDWTIEFYWDIFKLVGKDIHSVMEVIRVEGKLKHSIDTTFLALIPKSDLSKTFTPLHFVMVSIKFILRTLLCISSPCSPTIFPMNNSTF
jgi:hypothetical protein